MQFKVTRIDLDATAANWPPNQSFAPAYLEQQKSAKDWRVLSAPFMPGKEPNWYKCKTDTFMRIPLFPYRLHREADLAFAFMLQLGISCAAAFVKPVTDLQIVTGTPVKLHHNANDELVNIEYWIGVALALEE